MTAPAGRLRRVYDDQERAAIEPFKSDYLKATTPTARKTIAQVHIFPALFNHWVERGVELNAKDMQTRQEDLLGWLRNVWRTKKKPVLKPGKRYRLTDILWWTQREAVFREIASIMNLPSATTNTPGWFHHRTPASKNILDTMTDDDRKKLEEKAELFQVEGLPQDVQRKIADEKWYSRLSSAAREHYNEMGLVSVSIVIYTGKSGNLNVDMHDDIADIIGMPALPFEVMYPDKAKECKRAILEYVHTLHRQMVQTTDHNSNQNNKGTLEISPSGFPVAPRPNSWNKVTRGDLEPLYRMYMTEHYRLACRDTGRQTPFESIATKTSDFIDADFVAPGITINDPRSMKLDFMIQFFNHIAEREISHGIEQAFRFKAVLSSRKNGTLQPSRYQDIGVDEEMTNATARVRKKRPVPSAPVPSTPVPSAPVTSAPVTSDTTVPSDTLATPVRIKPRPTYKRPPAPTPVTESTSGPEDTPAPAVTIKPRPTYKRPLALSDTLPTPATESTSGPEDTPAPVARPTYKRPPAHSTPATPVTQSTSVFVDTPVPPITIKPRPTYRRQVPLDTPESTPDPRLESTSGILDSSAAPVKMKSRLTSGLLTPADSPAPTVQKTGPFRRSQRLAPVPHAPSETPDLITPPIPSTSVQPKPAPIRRSQRIAPVPQAQTKKQPSQKKQHG